MNRRCARVCGVVLSCMFGAASSLSLAAPVPMTTPMESGGYVDRAAPSTYQWDNGTGFLTAWFLGSGGEIAGIHAYDAVNGADALTSISCAWRGVANGTDARIFVWQDNGTGIDNATLIHEQAVKVQNSGDTGIYNRYPLTANVPVTGRFYVGFSVVCTNTGVLPARRNPTPAYVRGRAFLCGAATPPLNASALGSATVRPVDTADVGAASYLLLRADGLGTSFTYQGRLAANGGSYTGPADVRFTLYDRDTGGTAVAPMFEQQGVSVNDGLFTVLVPTDPSWFVNAPDRYLEVQVRTPADADFTTLKQRQRVTPVPTATVARVAQNAQTAQSVPWSGLLGVPTVLPPWVSAPNGIGYTGGSVGIGVANPGAGLHVKGGPKYYNSYFESADNEGTWVSFTNTDGPGRWWSMIVTGTNNTEAQGSLLFRDNNDASVRMMIDPTGRVGVGTIAPELRMTVSGSVQVATGSTLYNAISYPNSLVFGAYGGTVGAAENTDRIAFQRVNVLQNASQNVSELRLIIGDDVTSNANVADSFVIGAVPGGTWTGLFQFRSDGTAFKSGGGSWAAFCDPRLKHDITPMRGTLDRLLALRGYEFLYNDDVVASHRGLPGTQIGLMADEVERVFPDWISRDASGMRMVTERSTTALMVEALRDLRSEKDTQLQARDEKIQRLEKDNAELRERLERLEKAVGAQAK